MLHRVFTKTEIGAPAEIVWQILTDFNKYSEWNPFIISIKGNLKNGSRLKMTLRFPNGKKTSLTPRLKMFARNSELRWQGYFIMPGFFDAEHVFVVEKLSQVKTLFMHSESFSGILSPILFFMIRNKTQKNFESMNKALKARAESRY